jgi:predicted permease
MSTRQRDRRRFGRKRPDADFDAEIRAHLEIEIDRLIDQGSSPEAARDAARRSFGSALAAQERFHESTRWVWLEQIGQDLRYAWRGLMSSRAFVATTVLTLAVALSLTTVVFTIFNAYVLRPFAVRDPYSLYEIRWQSTETGGRAFAWRDYPELRARDDVFDDVLAERRQALSSDGRTLSAAFVSGNYFEMLGARVLLGRALGSFDARTPAGEPVVVLSHQAWTRLFDRDPTVVGRWIELNDQPFEIVGVLRPEFSGLDEVPLDLWLPLTRHDELVTPRLFDADHPRQIWFTGRLRSGVSRERAASALSALMKRLVDKGDAVRAELRLQATPATISLEMLAVLSPVFAAFGLVLVTACANVSNMMLARGNARHREIGVRLSLGASRNRVVRQLLTEGLLISVLACFAALALAGVALRAGLAVLLGTLPSSIAAAIRVVPLVFDHRVFLFSLAVAAATTIMFALLPALQATRLSLTHALRGEAGTIVGTSRLRNVLVVGQVAVSVILLVVAITLARNGVAVATVDLGFETAGIVSVNQRGPGGSRVPRAATVLEADARVGQVAVTSRNPLFGEQAQMPVEPAGSRSVIPTSYMFVSPEFFSLLPVPIVRGRNFQPEEARAEAPVAIISASGARALWGGADPLGKTVRARIEDPQAGVDEIRKLNRIGEVAEDLPGIDVTIVGVAKDVVNGFVYQGRGVPHLYLPTTSQGEHAGAIVVRGRAGTNLRLDTLRTVLQRADSNPLAFEILPLDDVLALQTYPMRAASWIGLLLGAVALALSVSGLYGVLTYTWSQRTREIGVRMALGATATAVVRLVISQSTWLAGLGAAVGLAFAFSVMKALSVVVRLENVSVLDVVAFTAALTIAMAAAALAGYVPARRAARTDPSQTLRADA